MLETRKLEFLGADGSRLSARLCLPPGGEVEACALFAHCFTCSKDLKAAVNISRALTQQRIAVFRFDFTGLGESEGDFADTTFSSNIDDLVAAADFMERELAAPSVLVGHSLGGAAVLQAATYIESTRAVSTIAAPFKPEHVKHLFSDRLADIEASGEAEVTLAGRSFTVTRQFIRDLGRHDLDETIAGLGVPLLLFHSPADRLVDIDNAAKIYRAARHPKSFVSLDRADHLLLEERDSLFVGAVLGAWAKRYLDEPASEKTPDELRTGDRVVARTGSGAFTTEIGAGRHNLVADEPESVGGDDRGPTPYDLLAAALGACTTMTLRMYADRKGWPLEEAVARLRHTRIHAEDDERCEDEDARVDQLHRSIELTGPLDEEQRARLLEIAERCPVHRTLDAGVRITTELGPPDSRPEGAAPE